MIRQPQTKAVVHDYNLEINQLEGYQKLTADRMRSMEDQMNHQGEAIDELAR